MLHARPEPDPADALAVLRHETAGAHAEVERVPRLARLLAPDLTVADYAATLALYHRHFAATEPVILSHLAPHLPPDVMQSCQRAPLVAADLRKLGQPVEVPAARSGPGDLAEAVGWFYVHEGAALGGRVILKAVQRSLGEATEGATLFLSVGADPARSWRDSRAMIAGLLQDEGRLPGAVRGARAAFAAITTTMS